MTTYNNKKVSKAGSTIKSNNAAVDCIMQKFMSIDIGLKNSEANQYKNYFISIKI